VMIFVFESNDALESNESLSLMPAMPPDFTYSNFRSCDPCIASIAIGTAIAIATATAARPAIINVF